jgi:naphthalene 1,2-dioxygenase system ferredoxin subunit
MSQDNNNWIEVLPVEDIPDNDVFPYQVAGKDIAIYGVDGQVYASDNLCTHGHARLSDGFMEGCEIECPLHQGKFDVRTGAPTCAPVTEAIKVYPVKIESGKVLLQLL